MTIRWRALARNVALGLGVLVLGLGSAVAGACSDKAADGALASASGSGSASADAMANFGGKIGKALRAPPSAISSASSQLGGEPPPQGIFAPGDADKIVRRGAPQVTVFDEGASPKVNLSSYVLAGEWKIPLALQVSMGQRSIGVPALGMILHMRPLNPGEEEPREAPPEPPPAASSSASAKPSSAPKAPKAPASASPSARPAAGAPKPAGSASAAPSGSAAMEIPPGPPPVVPSSEQSVRMLVTISDAKVQADAAAVTPAQAELAAGLNGSSIVFTVSSIGPTAFRSVLGPGADQRLHLVLSAIEEILSTDYVPAPNKPIGTGGYFMVLDRVSSMGMDVVRYRVFKVVKVTGDVATLMIDDRQYAANAKIDGPPGAPDQGELAGYAAVAKGVSELPPKSMYPVGTILQFQMQAAIGQSMGGLEFLAQLGAVPAGVQFQAGPGDEE
ncbi:MAG: hypothetical protein U0414_14915 [Polyangiaceae bacterium]